MSRRALLALLAALAAAVPTGCATPFDTWTPTRETCGVTEPLSWEVLGPEADRDARPDLDISETCARALVRDLGDDPDRILGRLGLADTFEGHLAADAEDGDSASGLTTALHGMYWLLGADLGEVEELEPDSWTSPTFSDETGGIAETLDLEKVPVAQALYVHVTDHVRSLGVNSSEVAFRYSRADHRLWLPPSIDTGRLTETDPQAPVSAAGILAHEARHDVPGGAVHTTCGEASEAAGQDVCDDDLTGGYGFSIAILALACRRGASRTAWDIPRALELVWVNHVNLDYPGPPPLEP